MGALQLLLDRSGLPDTAVDYKKALEARKLLSASDLHGNRRHSEKTTQMLTQQCRRRALLAMSA
jgi:hypothetical protein